MTIIEFFGKCKKINVINAFYFIKYYGLLDFPCRGQSIMIMLFMIIV
jgi:hypothetical protein